MVATFTYAVRYDITATCCTPLRTSDIKGNADAILRSWDGTPILQGASLAGALKTWIADADKASILFGSPQQEGVLIVSDGVFNSDAQQLIRPRLRINGAKGTADQGGKFDVAHISAGETFRFSVIWRGKTLVEDEIYATEQMLAALNAGEIFLGAQKSNGFGQVRLVVKKRIYHLENEADRAAWLNDVDDGVPYSLPQVQHSDVVVFTVSGQMKNVLVKSGTAEQFDRGSMATNLEENGVALIPGSSVKGAIRARAEAIAALLGVPKETVDEIFGRGAEPNSEGDNGIAGKVRFSDVRMEKAKRQKINRIRLDSFTGGVMHGGLFAEEPLNSEVKLRIFAPNDGQACRLLLYALRDFGLGLYGLGSGGSIGRGLITEAKIQAVAPDGRKMQMLFDKNRQCTLADSAGLAKEWLSMRGGAEF